MTNREYVMLEDKNGKEVLPVTDGNGVFVEGGTKKLDKKLTEINEQLDTIGNEITSSNVSNYGAKGDGMTDDTNAFKRALEENNVITFGDGDFIISDSLLVHNKKSLIGNGKNSRLIVKNSFDIIKVGYKANVSNFVIDTRSCITFNNSIFSINENTLPGLAVEGNSSLQSRIKDIEVFTTSGGNNSSVITLSMTEAVSNINGYYDVIFENIFHKGYNNGFKYFFKNYCKNNKWITGISLINCNNQGTVWGIFDGENDTDLNDSSITSCIDKLNIINYQHQCQKNTKAYIYLRNGEKTFINSVAWDWHLSETDFKGIPFLINSEVNYPLIWNGSIDITKVSILQGNNKKNLSYYNKTLFDKYFFTQTNSNSIIIPKIISVSNYSATNSLNDVKSYLIYRGTKLKTTNEQLIFYFRTRTTRCWCEICVFPTIDNSELKYTIFGNSITNLPYGYELRWRNVNGEVEIYLCASVNHLSLYDLLKTEILTNSQMCYSEFYKFTNYYVTINNFNNEYLTDIPEDLTNIPLFQ